MKENEKYLELTATLEQQIEQVTQKPENWLNYLDGASRNYKYSFTEQLLINEQKPNATAIADYDFWTKKAGRIVKRSNKSIGYKAAMSVPVIENGQVIIKNYFDITDTIEKEDSKLFLHWGRSNEKNETIIDRLSENHDLSITSGESLDTVLFSLNNKLSKDYLTKNIEEIEKVMSESDLSNAMTIEQSNNFFEDFVVASTGIIVNKRLGLEDSLTMNPYETVINDYLYYFAEPTVTKLLGNTVSTISEEILREIEVTVKAYDKIHNINNNLQQGRDSNGIHTSRKQQNNSETRTTDQVGISQIILSERLQQTFVSENDNPRTAQPLPRDRETSEGALRNSDGTSESRQEEPVDRARQEQRPNDMGGTNEQHEKQDIRNDLHRLNLQLNNEAHGENQGAFFMENFVPIGDEVENDEITLENETFEPLNLTSSPPKSEMPLPKSAKPKNFRLDSIDYSEISQGGAKSKYKRNIEAIKTLKLLETENRPATHEEQVILAKYVGWGGISDAFGYKEEWQNEISELKELLTPDEYENARASVLTAYYTDPVIMNAMWQKINAMGGYESYDKKNLKAVNILEPSMGVGNFLGTMPKLLSDNTTVSGVEIDSISGRIARLLYPEANVQVTAFEKTLFQNEQFDIVIGNVPFSESIKPIDWQYETKKPEDRLLIHDYFFNKALDKTKPGGIVALITSTGTLDKQDDKARLMMHQKAEFLGAVRLPNTAFKQNAGTEVVSDIIFLQKREELLNLKKETYIPAWVNEIIPYKYTDKEVGFNQITREHIRELRINSYFHDNPHMILGEYKETSGPYGTQADLLPTDSHLGMLLRNALDEMKGTKIPTREIVEEIDEAITEKSIAYNSDLSLGYTGFMKDGVVLYPEPKNYAYTLIEDEVYYREGYFLHPQDVNGSETDSIKRQKGMIILRDKTRELIQAQVDDRPETEIKLLQSQLLETYNTFTDQFGYITTPANAKVFDDDDGYFLLTSLESFNEDGEFERLSDIFTKRTIKPTVEITHADTSADALAVSMGQRGYVDMAYMMELTGFAEEKIVSDLHGQIFLDLDNHIEVRKDANGNVLYENNDPTQKALYNVTKKYVTADEYLSGNVVEKLQVVSELVKENPSLAVNVEYLEKIQPVPLEAHEITVRLGATWIDPVYIQQFMYETLETPNYYRGNFTEGDTADRWSSEKKDEKENIVVRYSRISNEWRVTNKNSVATADVKANVEFGTPRINAYEILEKTLNLKDIVIKDKVTINKREVGIINEEQTILVRQKQEDLKNAFTDWLWNDPERRQTLTAKYNEKFNSTVERKYDGSHLTFSGMNAEITLDAHQLSAVARGVYGGNTLLAHVVGAGKTFEMSAIAMESKKLGLVNKNMFIVPNHLTGQMAGDFLRLYPNANVLVATEKTFEKKNRKKFIAKVATGNYDAIIMGHSQFGKIPMSKTNREKHLKYEYNHLMKAIEEAKRDEKGYFTVKQMENAKNKVKNKLDSLYKEGQKDDVVTFEELGIDKLFVDEAHEFKNLQLYTKMNNVAGINTTDAAKSSDLFMKCRYLDEVTSGKGIVFATGTPISNSLTELYTMKRYLQYDKLLELDMEHFDQWASTFIDPVTDMELAPEGKGYRMRTRCSKFHNLPELMSIFREVADIVTHESLNLPKPEANFHTVVAKPSSFQKEMVNGLALRAKRIRDKQVDIKIDNMLAITTDGRKLGLDQRVVNPDLPDEPTSKINMTVENIVNIYHKGTDEKLTQVVFCDLSTPSGKGENRSFNVYDDMKQKLIDKGVPAKEIVFIHDTDGSNSDKKKQELFSKIRKGTVRVVFGSSSKMGSGTNIQDKLVALHHLDAPWRPSDIEQREGRILRRGNQNKSVDIYKYVTEETFDAYMFSILATKQSFISQIMTEKSPLRTVDFIDESTLAYEEIASIASGDPRIKEKMTLDQDIRKLTSLKRTFIKTKHAMEDTILQKLPTNIKMKEQNIINYNKDLVRLKENTVTSQDGISPMLVNGQRYTDRIKAGEAIEKALKMVEDPKGQVMGSYRGFNIHLSFNLSNLQTTVTLKGDMSYPITLDGGINANGVVTRLDNVLDKIPEYIENNKQSLEETKKQLETAKIEVVKPFKQEEELKEKQARLVELVTELSLDSIGNDNGSAIEQKTGSESVTFDETGQMIQNDLADKTIDNQEKKTILGEVTATPIPTQEKQLIPKHNNNKEKEIKTSETKTIEVPKQVENKVNKKSYDMEL